MECTCEVGVATQQHRQCIERNQMFQRDRKSSYFLSSSKKSALAGFKKQMNKKKEVKQVRELGKGCHPRVHEHTVWARVRKQRGGCLFFPTTLWKWSERALPTLLFQNLTWWQRPCIPQLRSASVSLSWTKWKQLYQALTLPQALAFERDSPAVPLWDFFLVWEDLAKRKSFHLSVAFAA